MRETERPVPPMRILIVDAYQHSREGLSDSLRVSGYHVDAAAGSWEAVQKSREGHFGLAIIDLDLPPAEALGVSGWDLARIIRAFHPGVALILVTAEWRPELTAQTDAFHRARLMEKPIHPAELRALVKAFQCEAAAGSGPTG